MTNPRTIEAFQKAGVDFKDWHEKGNDRVVLERKEQLKKDTNQKVIVNSVSRKLVTDENRNPVEVIVWWQQTLGHTGLGNPVEYVEGPEDLCVWYEPIATTKNIFNSVTEEMETVTTQWDFSDTKKHWLYPFTKENIDLVKRLTANNPKCNWGVVDESTGKARSVENFEDWSTKDFDTLLNPPRQPLSRQELDRLLGLGLQHQTQDARPQYH